MRQNDQMIMRMRNAIADLKCGSVIDAEYEASPVSPSPVKTAEISAMAEISARSTEPETPANVEPTVVEPAAGAAAEPAEEANLDYQATVAAQALLAELRKAGEALLREVSTLETHVNEEAQVVQATRDHAAAAKKADGAAIAELQAKELAQTASKQYSAAATARKSADELAASARTDAEKVDTQIASLERWLCEARTLAQDTSSKLEQYESRAQDCAAAEDAARYEATEAAARVAAGQAASLAAAKEAQAARERAEALKQALPQPPPTLTGISNVQTIATRIVEEAAALTRDSGAKQRDPLLDTAQWQW